MPYEKTIWNELTAITPERLQKQEDGIGQVTYDVDVAMTQFQTDVGNAIAQAEQSVVSGKNLLETSIKSKTGTIVKIGSVATFEELNNGVKSIDVKDHKIGDFLAGPGDFVSQTKVEHYNVGATLKTFTDYISSFLLPDEVESTYYELRQLNTETPLLLTKFNTKEETLWEIDLGSATHRKLWLRNVFLYCFYRINNTNTIIKIDKTTGAIIWTKSPLELQDRPTDDITGNGGRATLDVDESDNLYIGHRIDKGKITLRKLNSNLGFEWENNYRGQIETVTVDTKGVIICQNRDTSDTVYTSTSKYLTAFHTSTGAMIWTNTYAAYSVTYVYTVWYDSLKGHYVDINTGVLVVSINYNSGYHSLVRYNTLTGSSTNYPAIEYSGVVVKLHTDKFFITNSKYIWRIFNTTQTTVLIYKNTNYTNYDSNLSVNLIMTSDEYVYLRVNVGSNGYRKVKSNNRPVYKLV